MKVLHITGKHCKTIVAQKNEYFYNYVPEFYSRNITILGKLSHDDNGNNSERKKFVGPVWADINDQNEWNINQTEEAISRLSEKAVFHNGLYYGVLDNEIMKIGKNNFLSTWKRYIAPHDLKIFA